MDAGGEGHACMRIADANTNRAREALRVIEEFCRFVLEDAALTARCKHLRHDLQAVAGPLTQVGGWSFRDTAGDVGTALSTVGEETRCDAAQVLDAACGRLGEALRVLEEYGKTVDPAHGKAVKQLRYESYGLTAAVQRRAHPRHQMAAVKLYVLLTEANCRGPWLDTARSALAGGARALQLREKALADRRLLERARVLRQLCDEFQALLIINDRVDVAVAARADGVHVGQDDVGVGDARRILGPYGLVGVSTHTLDQARAALAQVPDYLAVGPMFASTTKPQAHVAGPQTLERVRELTTLPLVAIGGITAANAAQLGAADALAVCDAVVGAGDVTAAARALVAAAGGQQNRC